MAPFKKKQRTLAEIALAPKTDRDTFNSSPDHFLSHETISGTAIFALEPDVKFDHAKITLKGMLMSTNILDKSLTIDRIDTDNNRR